MTKPTFAEITANALFQNGCLLNFKGAPQKCASIIAREFQPVMEALASISGRVETAIERDKILWLPDHACAECVGEDGEIVKPGFRCGRHAALHILGAHEPKEPSPQLAAEAGIAGLDGHGVVTPRDTAIAAVIDGVEPFSRDEHREHKEPSTAAMRAALAICGIVSIEGVPEKYESIIQEEYVRTTAAIIDREFAKGDA